MDEIVIVQRPKKRLKKKENPAYKILKKIWKNRKKNGLKKVDKYEYRKYETTEIGMNRLDTIFLKKLFKKDYDQMIKELSYDNEGFHYYIPIYIKEVVYRIYGNNRLKKETGVGFWEARKKRPKGFPNPVQGLWFLDSGIVPEPNFGHGF